MRTCVKVSCFFSLCLLLIFCGTAQTIVITNNSGTNVLTCGTKSINLTATSNGFTSNATFTWSSANTTLTGSTIDITVPGTFTVISMNGPLPVTQTLTISQNTVLPISSLSSTLQVTSTTIMPTFTFTAISPTTNIVQYIYDPFNGTVVASSYSVQYSAFGPGTYTHCILSTINQCSSCKLFSVVYNPLGLSEKEFQNKIEVYFDQDGVTNFKVKEQGVWALFDLSGNLLQYYNLNAENNFHQKFLGYSPGLYVLGSEVESRRIKVRIDRKN